MTCDTAGQLAAISRIGLGGIFAASAIAKARSPQPIQHTIRHLGLGNSTRFIVHSLVAVEIVLGIWLISGFQEVTAIVSAIGLMLFFSAMQWWLWQRGYQHGCGCFGGSISSGVLDFIRNTVMLIAGMAGLFAALIENCPALMIHEVPAFVQLGAVLAVLCCWLALTIIQKAPKGSLDVRDGDV